MAVTKIGPGQWHSSLVDKVFDSEEAARHYDEKQEQILRGRTEQEKFLDDLPAEQLRSYLEREMLADANRDASNAGKVLVDVWLAAHPEYLDSKHNGDQIAIYLKMKRGNAMPRDTRDIDEAVEALSRAGALQVDQAKLDAKYRRDVEAQRSRYTEYETLQTGSHSSQ